MAFGRGSEVIVYVPFRLYALLIPEFYGLVSYPSDPVNISLGTERDWIVLCFRELYFHLIGGRGGASPLRTLNHEVDTTLWEALKISSDLQEYFFFKRILLAFGALCFVLLNF